MIIVHKFEWYNDEEVVKTILVKVFKQVRDDIKGNDFQLKSDALNFMQYKNKVLWFFLSLSEKSFEDYKRLVEL